MSHFPFLDQAATIKKTKKILSQYCYLHNIERSLAITIKSPIISDMPKSAPTGNGQEDKLVDKFEKRNYAKFFCELVRDIITIIENEDYQAILRKTYLEEGNSSTSIMIDLNIGEAQFYRMKNEALLVFAQNFPPFNDLNGNKIDLLVYKN